MKSIAQRTSVPRKLQASLMALALALLAGCGGADEPGTPAATKPATNPATTATTTPATTAAAMNAAPLMDVDATAQIDKRSNANALVAPPLLIQAPFAAPTVSPEGAVQWPIPVAMDSDVRINVKPFATLPLTTSGQVPRLNALAYRGQRLFVVEETDGRIYEITGGTPLLWFDVASAILAATGRHLDVSNAQGGLRSLAFHPNFSRNGKLYTTLMEERPANTSGHTYLSDVPDPVQADSVLVEWTANPRTMVVDPASYREVFRVGIPVYDHPIKQLMFRPGARSVDADYGLLYIAHGDGSVQSVVVGGGMNRDARGKILRINPLKTATAPYAVPASNPFVGNPNMIPEVYTLGHRNPHHLSFTTLGDILVTEVGRDNVDEINVIRPGANYGWPEREGTYKHLPDGGLMVGITTVPANDASFGYTYPASSYLHAGPVGSTFTGLALGGGYPVDNGSALSGWYFSIEFVFSGAIYINQTSDLLSALTTGEPALQTEAPLRVARVAFDHDSNLRTPALLFDTMGEVTKLAATYDQSGRVDMRYGQGPKGELYLMSKRNRMVYLVTNSKATRN